MQEDDSSEFSDDGLDEFEESMEDRKQKPPSKNQTAFANKPYDEAYDLSQDLSMAESYDGREKPAPERERKLRNDRYDEAVEVSQSLDQSALNMAPIKAPIQSGSRADSKEYKDAGEAKGLNRDDQSKSQSVLNRHFDEALEFSQSESEESIDTARGRQLQQQVRQQQPAAIRTMQSQQQQPVSQPPQQRSQPNQQPIASQQQPKKSEQQPQSLQQQQSSRHAEHEESSEEENENENENEHEESYDNIEGAYNPKDYINLSVPSEVRDLFQYIERYKPQEVELETPLKCFIPEYIPAIGELDAFIKIPRPDGKEDGCGLRYLDEPSSNQSDPTVLELQLRAKSKKLQYGDVAVRSIEHADKNPQKIDKWIQDINDLHRSKPPPQVNYKKNMPDIDKLMEAWPEEFESLLTTTSLPSPDLDLSLIDYVKVLSSILDIPVYDNPIESLHLMFSLYLEFKNNPHFQSRLNDEQADGKDIGGDNGGFGHKYGGADVLEIDHDSK